MILAGRADDVQGCTNVAGGRMPGATMIRERLAVLAPKQLEILDESHKHVGHAGAQSGGGHFKLTIVSNVFDGKGLLQRHRMVYDALGSAMQTDIHALTIKALTPEELPT